MNLSMLMSVSALVALLPAALLPFRRPASRPDALYWLLLAVALVGAAAYGFVQSADGWNSSFSQALWLSIASSLALFLVLAILVPEAWRLTVLLMPYLLLMGLLATIWSQSDVVGPSEGLGAWLQFHILVSLLTYGFSTLAAMAAAAVFLQERALKRKAVGALSRHLPSIADGESMQQRLLLASEIILLLGIVSGFAERQVTGQAIFDLDHKTLFSLLAFAAIAVLLFLHHKSGLRGRQAARIVLIAYLLLTLAYPGVKFVTDVLLS